MMATIQVKKLVQSPANACPFCSQGNLVMRGESVFHVNCLTCDAAGPAKPSAEEALDAWNEAGIIQQQAISTAVQAAVVVATPKLL
jgi:hypothetical protein